MLKDVAGVLADVKDAIQVVNAQIQVAQQTLADLQTQKQALVSTRDDLQGYITYKLTH